MSLILNLALLWVKTREWNQVHTLYIFSINRFAEKSPKLKKNETYKSETFATIL